MYYQQNTKIGSLFDNIIRGIDTGLNIFNSVQQGSGQARTQAKGLAQITAFCNQVLSALDQLKQQIANLPVAQRQQVASQINQTVQQLVSALSDSSQVYQAKNGQDATVLRNAKASAGAKASEISALLGQSQTSAPPSVPIDTPVVINPAPIGTQQPPPNTVPVTLEDGQIIYVQMPNVQGSGNLLGIELDDNSKKLLLFGGIGLVALFLLKK